MILDINFNFNTGDFYTDGSLLSAWLIAVGSVVMTVIVQRVYDNYKNDEKLDNLYDYLKLEANKLGINAVKQATELSKVSRVLKSEQTLNFDIPKVSAFNADQTKEWETFEFYDAIVLRRISKESNKLIELHSKIKGAFNTGRELEKSILKAIDDLNMRLHRVQGNWREHVQSIGRFYDIFARNNERNPLPNDYFLLGYYNVIVEWKKHPEATREEISIVYNQVVDPLKSLCRQYPLDDRAFYLLQELQELSKTFKDLTHIKKSYRKWFLNVARKLVKVKVDLDEGLNEIEKYKRRGKFHF